MKGDLIHPDLLSILAKMGHGQKLVIGDAGLPVPQGVKSVPLLVSPGVPSFRDVVSAVLSAMHVECMMVAEETKEKSPQVMQTLRQQAPSVAMTSVTHEELKKECETAVAIVRTGEYTPYANVVLVCGVGF